jgi:hypothetical protein
VIDDLSSDMRKALANAVKEVIPNVFFDEWELFRAFKRAVHRKCSTWEQVKDDHVDVDDRAG